MKIKCEKTNENSVIKKFWENGGRYTCVFNKVITNSYSVFSGTYFRLVSLWKIRKSWAGIKMENRKGRRREERMGGGQGQWKLSLFVWLCLLASVKGNWLLRTGVDCLVSWGVVPGFLFVCLYFGNSVPKISSQWHP